MRQAYDFDRLPTFSNIDHNLSDVFKVFDKILKEKTLFGMIFLW